MSDREKIAEGVIIHLEAASRLTALTAYERDFVQGLLTRFNMYGLKMVITEKQCGILAELAHRYRSAGRDNG